jgi:hypothetical protein
MNCMRFRASPADYLRPDGADPRTIGNWADRGPGAGRRSWRSGNLGGWRPAGAFGGVPRRGSTLLRSGRRGSARRRGMTTPMGGPRAAPRARRECVRRVRRRETA